MHELKAKEADGQLQHTLRTVGLDPGPIGLESGCFGSAVSLPEPARAVQDLALVMKWHPAEQQALTYQHSLSHAHVTMRYCRLS